MAKRKADCTSEEWDRQKAMSRERNKKYLANGGTRVKEMRSAAHKAYIERLKTDSRYTVQALERKAKAVQRTKTWQEGNPEKVKQHARTSRQAHPEREAAKVQRRNAAKLRAAPAWADTAKISRHYENARYLSEVTGCLHHVDHIIPLRGKEVCGLHVEGNLRVVPHFVNTRKGNKLIEVKSWQN